MKYIVRRILIGVGIALAMMFITRTFSLSVYAVENTSLTPDKVRMTYYQSSETTTDYNIANFTTPKYPSIQWYGKTATGNNIRIDQLRYHFDVSSLKKGYHDITFLSYHETLLTSYVTNISWSIHQQGNWYSCTSSSNSSVLSGQSSVVQSFSPYVQSVTCTNVYINPSNTNLYLFENNIDSNNASGSYGISNTTFLYNSTNSQQEIIDNQNTIIEQQQQQQDFLEDDDTTDAESTGSGFFNNFSNTDHRGISGIITAPLRYIQAFATFQPDSCQPISLKLPFMEDNATLPCVSTMISRMNGGSTLLSVIRLIVNGMIAYYVLIKIFAHIRSFKKPDEDKVEVLEL